jgi:hypothetical protein
MRYKWIRAMVSWLVLVLLAGCSQGTTINPNEMSTTPPTSILVRETESTTPTEISIAATQNPQEDTVNKSTPQVPSDPALEPLVQQARQDLAQRLNIAEDHITLIEAKAVVWPDASLGCPQPDMLYAQVPHDGALILLKVGEREYEYHSGGSRGLFLCEKSLKTKKVTPNIDIVIPPPKRSGDE